MAGIRLVMDFLWWIVGFQTVIALQPSLKKKQNNGKQFVDYELRVHSEILKGYERDIHPSDNSSKVVKVTFDVQLIRILEISERDQFIKVYLWVNQYWNNPLLRWNPQAYGGVTSLHIDPAKVWVPDIVLYNSVDEDGEFSGGLEAYKHKVQVNYDGKNSWLNPAIFRSICTMDVQFFPFDDQICNLKFGSWAHDASRIDIDEPANATLANDNYIKHGEWELLDLTAKRNAKTYQCCENPFVDMTLTISVRRHAISYELTLIIPCAVLSSLVYLGFILPPESGERIGLSITVLLAVIVFQEMTSQLMPRFDFPFLAQYYLATIFQTAFSLVVTTVILNFYHRSNREMPWLVRLVLLKWMYPVLFCASKKQDGEQVQQTVENRNRENIHSSVAKSRQAVFQRAKLDQDVTTKALQIEEELIKRELDDINTQVEHIRKISRNHTACSENLKSEVNEGILITITDCDEGTRTVQSHIEDQASVEAEKPLLHTDEQNEECPTTETNNEEDPMAHKKASDCSVRKRLMTRGSETQFAIGQSLSNSAFMLLGDTVGAQGNQLYKKKVKKQREQILEERKRDWVKAARVLDRFFLILFITTSTALLVVIFCRAPRFSS